MNWKVEAVIDIYLFIYSSVSQPFLPMPHFFHTKNLAPHQHTNKHNQNENFKINGNLLIITETFTLIESFSENPVPGAYDRYP